MFQLDPRLAADTIELGQFPLCRLLLMNDRNYPWCILVPQQPNLSEVYQLTEAEQRQLAQESSWLAKAMADGFAADKMNVAAIGNLVNQLHIHHIVRYRHDPLWPAPIWGKTTPTPYDDESLRRFVEQLLPRLAHTPFQAKVTP